MGDTDDAGAGAGNGHERAGRGRPRRADVERAAFEATTALIAERGYAGTTIDEIARRARLAKTTLYRRWPSKGELAVAALVARLGEPPVAPVPGRDGLATTIAWLAGQVSDPSSRLLLVGLMGEAAGDVDVRSALRAQLRDPFTRRLATGWELAPPLVDLAFDVVVGTLLHRVVMTGRVEAAAVAAVTELATGLLFAG